ncbi:MAG TPA: nuclease [Arenimonas sp.]|nr:MAG: hypothetical protein A2X76_09130 [Xanthomonadales bacterium GWF1_69_6]HBD21076.1 nuclease [Arenimonas sp.]
MSTALRGSLLLVLSLAAGAASAQAISLTGGAYTQDFYSLSNTAGSTTNATLPAGWLMTETGGGARDNEQYAVDTGASNTGDTYSYGAAGTTDRALGGLQSGTLIPVFGACFSNDTGSTVTELDVAYTGEQWRLGTAARTDRLDFQYSVDATALNNGTWVNADALDFSTPNTATTGAKNGNDVANRTAVAATIEGLSLANGAGFCVRWTDLNASGADDGLAVDDFSITAAAAAPAPDYSVAISATPNPVGQGGQLVVSTVFSNVGQVDLPTVISTQPQPAGTTFVTGAFIDLVGEPSASCSVSITVECSVALPAGSSITLTLTYNVAADATGPLEFTVTGAPPVEDTNDANDSATTSVNVVQSAAIHQIQGTGRNSPLAGQQVITRGIVTAVRTAGYYLQTPDAEADADPLTSQGIYVFTGNGNVPAQAVVGNLLEVTGTVAEYTPSSNPHQQPLTELTNSTVASLVSSGNLLPAAVEITADLANPDAPVDTLERLEGMRVSIARLVATAPGEGFIDENDALSEANGNFWGVVEGVARPFREEGVGALDVTPGIPANTPVFDTNPERIRVQSTGQVGAPIIALDAQAVVTGLVGVLDYGFGTYTLLPDPGAPVVVEGGAVPTAVADPAASEFTIAGFNLLRFYDDVNDAGGDTVLTTLAFERRVAKTARAICEYVKTPDILGVVEVENLNALTRLADAINTNVPGTCARNPQYVAYLVEGNDVGKINIGFLVSTAEVRASVPRVEVLEVVQYGKNELITNPNSTTSILHDRPPLVLRAVMNGADGSREPVTVIGNHLLSLIDINSLDPGSNGYPTTGDRRRTKRALQAVYTANLVEQFQQANPSERIVLLGDFNAFEFNDGYVDVMGIIGGQEAANDEVLQYAASPLSVPLTNTASLSPAAERYSFSFEGNAQTLDHLLVNQSLLRAFPGLRTEHARINADFGVDNYGDDEVPLRVSDHDPVVLYLSKSNSREADLWLDLEPLNKAIRAAERNVVMVNLSNLGPEALVAPTVSLMVQARPAEIELLPPGNWTCTKTPVQVLTLVTCRVGGGLLPGDLQVMEMGITLVQPVRISRLDILGWAESLSVDTNAANDREALKMPVSR